ncbi:hypothetical protein F4779DRAFT_612755 [Xylariaceae sp. FL0662B]|nr:hypothetical protein F4779DRAFT_612755 [Xylariaceae sp. FL0662B]
MRMMMMMMMMMMSVSLDYGGALLSCAFIHYPPFDMQDKGPELTNEVHFTTNGIFSVTETGPSIMEAVKLP